MANSKMTDFRNSRKISKKETKEALANHEILSQRLETATTLLFGLSKRVFEMDKKVRDLTRTANAADWRSSAILEVLAVSVDQNGVPLIAKASVSTKAEELQIEDFDARAVEFDKINGLVPVDGPAEKGHFATVSMDYFKDGVKLEEQKTVRSKIHLGEHELFPELDAFIMGMKVGETRKFPLSLMGLTDDVEVFLIDLKKAQPKEAPPNEPAKTEGH